jgi:hypothetical protein
VEVKKILSVGIASNALMVLLGFEKECPNKNKAS